MESHGQTSLSEGLDGFRFTEQASTCWNQDVLPAVRVQRVRDQTVHGRGGGTIETIRQDGIDHRSFEDPMQWTIRRNGSGGEHGNQRELLGNTASLTVESGQIVAIMPYFGSLLVSLIWGTDTKPEMAGDAERGRMEYAGTAR